MVSAFTPPAAAEHSHTTAFAPRGGKERRLVWMRRRGGGDPRPPPPSSVLVPPKENRLDDQGYDDAAGRRGGRGVAGQAVLQYSSVGWRVRVCRLALSLCVMGVAWCVEEEGWWSRPFDVDGEEEEMLFRKEEEGRGVLLQTRGLQIWRGEDERGRGGSGPLTSISEALISIAAAAASRPAKPAIRGLGRGR